MIYDPTWVMECRGNRYSTTIAYDDKEEAAERLFAQVLEDNSIGEDETGIKMSGTIIEVSTGDSWEVNATGGIFIIEEYEVEDISFGETIKPDPGMHPSQMLLEEIISDV